MSIPGLSYTEELELRLKAAEAKLKALQEALEAIIRIADVSSQVDRIENIACDALAKSKE